MKRSPTSLQLSSQASQETIETPTTEAPSQTVDLSENSWVVNLLEEPLVTETRMQPPAPSSTRKQSLCEQVLRRNASKYDYPSNEGNSR